MNSVLLINPPSGSTICKSFTIPLGICALKAYLNKYAKNNVSVLDLNIKSFLQSEHKSWWEDKNLKYWLYDDLFYKKILPELDINGLLNQILTKKPDIIGFSVNAASVHSALFLIREIKKQTKVKVVAGGALCHENNAEMFLKSGVDAAVVGEGEETFLELASDFKLHKGVYMLDKGKLVYGGRRGLVDIETLPYPDFDDIIDDYRKIGSKVWLSTSFVRGCPNRCAFCEESPFWKKVRQRSPENIVKELIFLKNRYKSNYFYKSDSILAANAETLEKICDYIIDNNLKIYWFSQARLDKWLTKDLLVKMKRAGCTDLSFGAESGSQKVLDFMHKNTRVNEMERIIKEAKQAGINVNITLMVGAPKETFIDFLKTIRFVLKTRAYLSYFMVSTAMLLPRSDWTKNPEKYGIKKSTRSFRKSYATNRLSTLIKKKILELIRSLLSVFMKNYIKGGESSLADIEGLMTE